MAGTGPVRPVHRARLADAVHPAVPGRIRHRPGGLHGLPLSGRPAGPPRVRRGSRGGDHHGPAGGGLRQRGGPGHGGAPRARTARRRHPTGRVGLRPLRLHGPGRRLHAGGRVLGGRLPGRHPAAGQPHRHLRRQRHLHRGQHGHRLHRGRLGPLRGLRLAGARRRLAHRPRRLRGEPRGAARGHRGGPRRERAPVADPPAHDHRLALPDQAGPGVLPRLQARGRGGRRAQAGPGPGPRAELHPARGRRLPRPQAGRRQRPGRPSGLGRALHDLAAGQPRRCRAAGAP